VTAELPAGRKDYISHGLFTSFKLGFCTAQLGEPPYLCIELISSDAKQRPNALLEGMEKSAGK